jgi:DNA (cytosine-5)-methyltransferase 1
MEGSYIGPPTANQVRNEPAEDFLLLLKEWEKLCVYFSLGGTVDFPQEYSSLFGNEDDASDDDDDDDDDDEEAGGEVFEVDKILAICYGDPKETKKRELYLKVYECHKCLFCYSISFFGRVV